MDEGAAPGNLGRSGRLVVVVSASHVVAARPGVVCCHSALVHLRAHRSQAVDDHGFGRGLCLVLLWLAIAHSFDHGRFGGRFDGGET